MTHRNDWERGRLMKQGCVLICIIILMVIKIDAKEITVLNGEPLASYVGENGLKIISYSHSWNSEEKLMSIYNELIKNTHGNEMKALSTIYIYRSAPSNYPKGFASFYHEDYHVNTNHQFVYGNKSYIEIFNADQYTDISQLARILAHEYGHHFTFYYLMTKENLSKEEWINSEYAKIRQLDAYPLVTYLNQNAGTYSHEWDIAEIIAEDYVQLYGSELARKTRDYLDINERLLNNNINYYFYYNDFNLLPQENLDLKLAADVGGLFEYFGKLSGVSPRSSPEKLIVKKPHLSEINSVFKNYNEYIWQWSNVKVLEVKSQYEYTLLINPKGDNDYPKPLKTVYSGEAMTAVAGSGIDLKKGIGILTNYEGDYEARVVVKDRNGYMHSSPIQSITISPRDNSKIIFSDIPTDHWASDYIYDITNKGMVTGYSDNTFHPEGTITRAEFMTFLLRSIQDLQLKPVDNGSNWFVEEGYSLVALSTGILSLKDNHEKYLNGNISRREMAQMIYIMLRYSGVKVNINYQTQLIDVKDHDAFMEISVVSYYQIINGYKDNTFKPNNSATRAEAMKMLSKYVLIVSR